jgi:hypothetical protein
LLYRGDVGGVVSLLEYRDNTYSQNGEDGVLAEITSRLGLRDDAPRWCVEFGAWDGRHLSNTFLLVEKYGWNAVYIEGDPEKYRDLLETVEKQPTIVPVQAMVGRYKWHNSALDKLLRSTSLPQDYDFLSVDIDSYDLDVWESHTEYRPKIVCIEINSTIAPGRMHRHNSARAGNSFSSTVAVGKKKGYTPVCHTGNIIFVDNALVGRLDLPAHDVQNVDAMFLKDWVNTESDQKVNIVHTIANSLPQPIQPYLHRLRSWVR